MTTLLTFSLLIREDFWVFLPFLSDRTVFTPSDKCAEDTAVATEIKKQPEKCSLISKKKVNKKQGRVDQMLFLVSRCKLMRSGEY